MITFSGSQERNSDGSPKTILDRPSIYIPQKQQAAKPVERLIKLGKKRDRSINYLVVQAILEYLDRKGRKARLTVQ